jgi:hypothetical protein
MPQSSEVYTYRGGQKVILEKQPDEFTVRATPERLREIGISGVDRVSSDSVLVRTSADELDEQMDRARSIAPTHHAYYNAETGAPFLITDRVFVTFREPLPPEEVDAFAGRCLVQLGRSAAGLPVPTPITPV